MIKKPSGLDLKYQDLNTSEAIREYERDTMIWEIYNKATYKPFNPITDLKATYYPEIDDAEYDESDYDILSAMRNNLTNLMQKKDYYEGELVWVDNTIGICISLLVIIGAICSMATSYISTPICIAVACITPLFFKCYYLMKQQNAKRKLAITKKQISALRKEIKSMQKNKRK